MPRTIIITGASDGIGAAAARQLHAAGESVIVVGRSPEKTAAVAAELGVPGHVADFADLAQVRDLAATLRETVPRIDVLANNAGGIFGDRVVTGDGFELTFQVNHLAGFLLTHLLMDRLVDAHASVIQTASVAAERFARYDPADLQGVQAYSASAAYGNAKLANILFTKELHRRFHAQGVSSGAFHPGVVATSFASGSRGFWRLMYHNPLARLVLTSTETGGSRLAWLADGTPGETWQSGEYYVRNHRADTNALADDADLARDLWEQSAELVGL